MKQLTFILLAAILFVNCAEDDFTFSNQQGTERYISFATSVIEMEDMDATRGSGHYNIAHHHDMTGAATPMFARFTQTNNIDKYLKAERLGNQDVTRGRRIDSIPDFYDSFGLISFRYDVSKTWSIVNSTITPWVYNERVRRADLWRTAEYWPGTGRNLTFFAYAPYNAQGMALSPSTQIGTPWLHHEVPLDAQDQSDLLISANEHEVGNYNAVRHIDFKHICAGIRFGIGSQMAPGKITKIQLADVYGEGWYHFGEAQWDSVKTERTFTLDQTFNIAKGEKNKLLTTGDNVFMMVPQVVPEDGRILVTIDDGEEHVLETFISKDRWDIGTTTTYWLSTLVTDGDTVLSVAIENAPIAATGGTATYEVGSYYTTAYGTRSPIPWTAYYTIDDDTTKYYTFDQEALTAFTFSGGSNPVQTCDITAKAGMVRSVSQNANILKHRAILNENLAVGAGKKGSANCYVINNPGTYTLPCVYGNSLDGSGNVVSSSYSSNNFVNHANVKINTLGPKIPQDEINDAVIVWQDAKSLITPSSLQIVNRTLGGDTYKCIQFTIDTLNICEGNALIAVRNNSSSIMWSWHIWVTHNDINQTIRVNNLNNGAYGTVISDFLPYPLGFCERDTFNYMARTIHLTIIQPSTPDTARVSIAQLSAFSHSNSVAATYYQWGRKDPMIPTNGSGNKTLYDCSYTYSTTTGGKTLPHSISYPYLFYLSGNWCSTSYTDLWNINLTTASSINNTPVIKTIYDPSPPGFKVPCTAAFTGFTTTGNTTSTASQINGTWINHSQYGYGAQMMTNSPNEPSGNPTYLFMPAMGQRRADNGSLGNYFGTLSTSWMCGGGNPYDMEISSATVTTFQNGIGSCWGDTIWSVAE